MGFLPQIWNSKTLQSMKKAQKENRKRVYRTLTDYTPLVKNKAAEAYNGPKIGKLEAKTMPISDSDFINGNNTVINIPFNKEMGVPFIIKNIENAQSNIELLTAYTDAAREGLEDVYDRILVETMLDKAKTVNKITFSDSTKNVLCYNDILEARKLLNKAEAPLKGRYLLVDADVESQLFKMEEFKDASKFGSGILPEGVIGRVLGFDVIMSPSDVLTNTTGGITGTRDKKTAVFYQSLAIGWGRQQEFNSEYQTNAGAAQKLINIYSVLGAKEQEPDYIVTIREN